MDERIRMSWDDRGVVLAVYEFHEYYEGSFGREQGADTDGASPPRILCLPDHGVSGSLTLHDFETPLRPETGEADRGQEGGQVGLLPTRQHPGERES